MLTPLKPLLCRHDFYWSERHRADRCRGCGKTRAANGVETLPTFGISRNATARVAETQAAFVAGAVAGPTTEYDFLDVAEMDRPRPAFRSPAGRQPSSKVLKAEAAERRENLLALLDWIAEGGKPSRQESLDALLALIEDGHSADPIVFGPGAVDHFARLHQARRNSVF